MEFALVLPVLLLFIMGIVDFGRALFTYAQASSQLRQALRLAAVIGYDASPVPPYRDCDRMRAVGRSVFFAEAINTDITYLRVESLPSAWDSGTGTFDDSSAGAVACTGSTGPTDLRNGDVLRIRQTIQIRMITPLFPQLLTFILEGQRSVVTSITLVSAEYCGDLVCNVDTETAVSCPDDCATGNSNAPILSLVSPICNSSISMSPTVEINAQDIDVGDGPGQLHASFYVNGTPIAATYSGSGTIYAASWIPSSNGTYTVYASVTDNNSPAHTSATTPCNVEVSGSNPPVIVGIDPANGSTVQPSETVQIRVAVDDVEDGGDCEAGGPAVSISVDASSLAVTCDGTDYVADWTTPASGSATITVTATDSDSLTANASSTVTVDTCAGNCPPTVSISSPLDGADVSGLETIEIHASDMETAPAALVVEVSVCGGSYQTVPYSGSGTTYSYSWDTTAEATGSCDITAQVTDAGGQSATSAINVNVTNPTSIDVYSITADAGVIESGRYFPTVTIVVKDNAGQPAAGVLVDGAWMTDDLVIEPWSCTTDASGQCGFTLSASVKKQLGIRFIVNSISHAVLVYDETLYLPVPPGLPWIQLVAPG